MSPADQKAIARRTAEVMACFEEGVERDMAMNDAEVAAAIVAFCQAQRGISVNRFYAARKRLAESCAAVIRSAMVQA